MTYKVSIVDPNLIAEVWDRVEGFLDRVIPITDGRTTLAETLNRVLKDEATLWVVYNPETLVIAGAAVTRINIYPSAKFLVVEMLAGDDFDGWMDQMNDSLILFANHFDCDGIELIGRKGWVRKLNRLNWKEKFVTCQLMLKEKPDGENNGEFDPIDPKRCPEQSPA